MHPVSYRKCNEVKADSKAIHVRYRLLDRGRVLHDERVCLLRRDLKFRGSIDFSIENVSDY
jgi:hypothetical protein